MAAAAAVYRNKPSKYRPTQLHASFDRLNHLLLCARFSHFCCFMVEKQPVITVPGNITLSLREAIRNTSNKIIIRKTIQYSTDDSSRSTSNMIWSISKIISMYPMQVEPNPLIIRILIKWMEQKMKNVKRYRFVVWGQIHVRFLRCLFGKTLLCASNGLICELWLIDHYSFIYIFLKSFILYFSYWFRRFLFKIYSVCI